jgi:serine/threonine protein kinase
MSPERITGGIKAEDIELAKRADIWSIGVIMFILITGKLPFEGNNCAELFESIRKSDIKAKLDLAPPDAKQLLV